MGTRQPTDKVPFSQRYSQHGATAVDNEVPMTARIAIVHFFDELFDLEYLVGPKQVFREALRSARLPPTEPDPNSSWAQDIEGPLNNMEWYRVYEFLETTYEKLLAGVVGPSAFPDDSGEGEKTVSLKEVQTYFAHEVNQILAQENLAYEFVNGQFQKRGRPATQQNLARVGSVLTDPGLYQVREHFSKARKYFSNRENPDYPNSVKESVSALEACFQIMTGKPANDFSKAVNSIQGNEPDKMPPPLVSAMSKVHAYRGNAQGAGHASITGSKLTELEAELVLSLSAAFITYLYDLLSEPEDIPF